MPDCRLPLSDYHHADPRAEDLTYGRWAAVMDGWNFDPVANRVPKSTFEATDVVHWLTLDIARQAVRHANLDLETADRDRIGMVLGNTLTGEETRANTLRLRWPFLRRALRHAAAATGLDEGDEARLEEALLTTWRSAFPKINEDSLAGGLANTIAGRVCNVLDLHGGGYVVDGACASSLLAVATAAQLLDSGQLDIALAGGVDMSLDPFELVGFAKATALSAGDMNVYDRRGKGFIPGEGCGVVVLQRLDDARRDGRQVLAVLKGWGVSSDGKGGITAPSVKGQALALRRAYECAGYSPHTLDFVEGHGTGTAVGDRVELEGIAQALEAWGTPPARGVGVTSFKSIVGHTKAAAGIGGFIKAVLAVNQRVVPPTAGCVDPHDAFAGSAAALYPVLKPQFHAPDATLRAGVSAMGFGGINSHVTLESGDAPNPELQVETDLAATPWACEVFPLRASSLEALRQDVVALREDAAGVAISELTDLAVALAQRTGEGPWRACVVASTVEELCTELDQLAARLAAAGSSTSGPGFASSLEPGRLGFLFPGQGSQFIAMGAALVERYAWARERVAEADRTVADLPAFSTTPLSAFILRPTWLTPTADQQQGWKEALLDTRVAQPAIALCSALWVEHLERLGVRPAVVAGHSLGELTALYASGAYDAPTLVRLAALRGQAMHPGSMAALTCDATTARALLGDTGAVIGNLNAPDQTVVSGPAAAIDQVIARAAEQGVRASRLRVSNAFHSPLVAPASRALATDARVPTRALGRRTLPLSCTDGQAISKDVDLRAHLAAQIIAPVDFVTLAQQLAERCDLLIEVGPGRVLTGLVERCGSTRRCLPVESTVGRDREAAVALAEAFLAGAAIRWSALYEGRFVRPFVPARERIFYRNPCERPFPELVLDAQPQLPRSLRVSSGSGAALRLEELLTHLRTTLGASHVAVIVLNAYGRSVLAAQPQRPADLPGGDEGLIFKAIATGQPLSTRLLVAEPGYRPAVDGWPGTVLHAALAQPVDLDGEHALVLIARVTEEPFTEVDARTLAALSEAARPLIGSAFLEARNRRALELEARTRGWAEGVVRDEPVSVLIRGWIEAASDTFETEAASLFMYDADEDELFSVAACRRSPAGVLDHVQVRFAATRGLAGHVFRTGQAVHIDDAYADDRFNPEVDRATGFRTRTIDCMPLLAEDGRVLGVLQLLNRSQESWGHREHDRLIRLAGQLASLVSLHRLVEGVRATATPAPTPKKATSSSTDAQATLWRMISDLTGFSVDTLHGDLRLLDDLNLDSIKAGALLAELGRALALPPGTFEGLATATLSDVLARAGSVGAPDVDLEGKLYTMIEERTGFARASLHRDLRLLDDLNLDSIKAGALLAELAREAGGRAAPEGLANATLGEILDQLSTGARPAAAEPMGPRWVADFVVGWDLAPAEVHAPPERLTILGHGPLAELLSAALPAVRVVDDALTDLDGPARDLLVLMPEGEADVVADMTRLTALARLHDRFGDAGLARITFVQRGDGRFGQDDPTGAHLGLRALAASLAQDRPDLVVRALDLHADLSPEAVRTALIAELSTTRSGTAGVGADGLRAEPRLRRIDAADALGPAPRVSGGVALVTGGGKGITAECALALGEVTGCHLVLVGSSAPNAEVQQTIDRMAAAGLTAEYRRCDVSDGTAVKALVDEVRNQLGPITAVLHGAGINRPRPTLTVQLDQALAEIAPKLLGAQHLIAALADAPPALFVALTSVIGVLGMAGNAWYAFANERVDLELRRLARQHPGTRVLSCAYSVWDEVGMGVKLGSVDALAHRGISAIPVAEGVAHFRRWVEQVAPDAQVVTTGRMGVLSDGPSVATGRFAGEVRAHTAGVEHLTRVRLHPDLDRYVRDHDYRGSLLFPTVMGLEAMAQTALAALGRTALGDVTIEQILLERPIVVHPTRGEEIELRAFIPERSQAGEPLQVVTSIHTASSGFGPAHFQARFVFGGVSLSDPAPIVGEPLDLRPITDLYSGLLFQGPAFQRIRRVFDLDARDVVFETEAREGTLTAPEGFSDATRAPLCAGDPYHRDTLLQAAQLVVTPEIALPVRIDRIELRDPSARAGGPAVASARFLGRQGDTLFAEVRAWDAEGRLVERITGYNLAVLERDARLPDVHGLLHPDLRDAAEIQRLLDEAAGRWDLLVPRVALAHHRGLHEQPRPQRRLVTEPLLALAARAVGCEAPVAWEDSGRPILEGTPDVGLSLTHDDTTILAVAGPGLQGCDLVAPVQHAPEIWRSMLARNAAVLEARAAHEGLHLAARMLWAAQEAGMKALGADAVDLRLLATADGMWRLNASDGAGRVEVVAFAARLARGGDRAVAVAVHPRPQPEAAPVIEVVIPAPVFTSPPPTGPTIPPGYGDLASEGASLGQDGPEGQWRFRQRSMVVFKEASEPSGSMRHSHYFRKMGELRELAARPVMEPWVADFLTGRWGAVTNGTRLIVHDAVAAGEIIEGSVWSAGLTGPLGSTMELRFGWEAVSEHGERRPLATGAMATTWVEITGHGEAKVAPNPDYFQVFADRIGPPPGASTRTLPTPDLSARGQLVQRPTLRPGQAPRFRSSFLTSREHSNIVGNVYFATTRAGRARRSTRCSRACTHRTRLDAAGSCACGTSRWSTSARRCRMIRSRCTCTSPACGSAGSPCAPRSSAAARTG
jgi:enediyne polyketide synthase